MILKQGLSTVIHWIT